MDNMSFFFVKPFLKYIFKIVRPSLGKVNPKIYSGKFR